MTRHRPTLALSATGGAIAGREVPLSWWVEALSGRRPLALAPASSRGWFSGTPLVAWDPVSVASGLDLEQAAKALEGAMSSDALHPVVAAALLPYEGEATVVRYEGGVVLKEAGWVPWGSLPAVELPEQGTAPLPREEPLMSEPRRTMGGEGYRAAVSALREAVARGDVYVANLTYALRGGAVCSPPVTFASLLQTSQGDMSTFVELPGLTLASVSPERFVSISGGVVCIEPIKGTRPRGRDGPADERLAAALAADAKERAEHVMIVDLERNDLGRVCEAGSVRVESLFEVVPLPYCHQMVSRVLGDLRPETGLADVLQAVFPSGSVTGAPKVAAMSHIRLAEEGSREAYTGSLVVAAPGALDSSVLIRTAEISGGELKWAVGAGITWESEPADEWLETLLKAAPVTGDRRPDRALRETCRVVEGRVPLWSRHKARLTEGGCGPSLSAAVDSAVAEAIAAAPDAVRSSGRLGVTVWPEGDPEVVVEPWKSRLDVPGGPSLAVVRVADPSALALPAGAAKPAVRDGWDRAEQTAREAGADQAVLADDRGRIVDGSSATLWLVFGDTLVTPPSPPAVAGIARSVVLDLAHTIGLEAEVAPLTVDDMDRADEIVLTNAVAGAVAARGRGGPRSRRLAQLFERLWRHRRTEADQAGIGAGGSSAS